MKSSDSSKIIGVRSCVWRSGEISLRWCYSCFTSSD